MTKDEIEFKIIDTIWNKDGTLDLKVLIDGNESTLINVSWDNHVRFMTEEDGVAVEEIELTSCEEGSPPEGGFL